MKRLILALAFGLIAIGCNRDEQESNIFKGIGYVYTSFCENGYVIHEMESDSIIKTTYLPNNLPDEFKTRNIEVEFIYKVISDTPQTCPGFTGYDKKIELINIKKFIK